MYEQDRGRGASVYIPPSYRGNALYFENLCREDPCEDAPNEHECEVECKKTSECRDSGLLGRFRGLFNSDSAVVIAVVLFLLFSKRDKCEDSGDDLLVIMLVALLVM